MNTPLRIAAAVAAILVLTTPVEAKRRNTEKVAAPVSEFCGDRYCVNAGEVRANEEAVTSGRRRSSRVDYGDAQIVGHPAGCPGRAFCGCGTCKKALGLSAEECKKKGLFLARNWLRFPRASCASGMVAARNGHVMYIQTCNGDGTVVAYDPNSGQRKTRIHTRSLSGYRVVNPHGALASR